MNQDSFSRNPTIFNQVFIAYLRKRKRISTHILGFSGSLGMFKKFHVKKCKILNIWNWNCQYHYKFKVSYIRIAQNRYKSKKDSRTKYPCTTERSQYQSNKTQISFFPNFVLQVIEPGATSSLCRRGYHTVSIIMVLT